MNQDVKVLSWITVVLGVWLIIAPFILTFPSAVAMWNSIIVGVIVLILSWIRAANPASSPGLSWINAILGLWLIVAPFVLNMATTTMSARWNDIVLGIAVIVFSVWAALATRMRTTT